MLIYVASLSHETSTSFQNRCFPLAAGLIAEYLRSQFPCQVEVEVFKSPSELSETILQSPPDVMMFSMYMWNERLTCAFAERIRELNPELAVIIGGPNFSLDEDRNIAFLNDNPAVDAVVLGEGEIPAKHLVSVLIDNGDRHKLCDVKFPNVLTQGSTNQNIDSNVNIVPWLGKDKSPLFAKMLSPYASGLFDKFFVDGERPLIETNRGCPFKCAFCQQGQSYFNKVRHYSLDYVRDSINYIAKKIHTEKIDIPSIEIADANLGMYQRDAEVMDILRTTQGRYGYPQNVGCSTGKNRLEIIMSNVERLRKGSIQLRSAMQSLNKSTLKAVKRDNIKLDVYYGIQKKMDSLGVDNVADIMLGLPEESVETHAQGIYDLLDMGVKEFACLQTIVLKGTEFEKREYREKYGIKTKLRPIPECHGVYNLLGKDTQINEMEEIVFETDRLSHHDYLLSRKLHLVIMIFHNTRLLTPIYQYLEQRRVKVSTLIRSIMEQNHAGFETVIDDFLHDTLKEQFTIDQTMPEDSDIEALTANKIFRYLAIALFTKANEICDVLHSAMIDVLGTDQQAEVDELVAIFSDAVISPTKQNFEVTRKITAPGLQMLFGDTLVMSISERQKALLELFNKMHTHPEDKINKMVYHLRPSNLSLKINSIMA